MATVAPGTGLLIMVRLLRQTRGASSTDYGILVGIIALIAIGAVATLGQKLNFNFRVGAQEVWMATHEEANFLNNGDFDDVDGLYEASYGFSAGTLDGWTSNNGLDFELHYSGYDGMPSVNGGYWLDMAATPGAMHITQEIESLVPGFIYTLTLFAGDRSWDLSNRTMVFWNGKYLGDLKATERNVMQEFRFHMEARSGINTLSLLEVEEGPNDNDGMSIDVIRIWGR